MILTNIYLPVGSNKKGQSLLEYAIVFVAVLVALLFMQTYVKQAISGKLRDTADDIGSLYNPEGPPFARSPIPGAGTRIGTTLYSGQTMNVISKVDPNFVMEIYGANYQIEHVDTKVHTYENTGGAEKVYFW